MIRTWRFIRIFVLLLVLLVVASRAQHGSNEFIIAHELMHVVGAHDRYDPATNQPAFPDGYAEPDLEPLLPQRKAEIMGGRIPVTRQTSETPWSLDDVVVGPITAREIAWSAERESHLANAGTAMVPIRIDAMRQGSRVTE